MLNASSEQLKNDQKMIDSLVLHYRVQHLAQICHCLEKALSSSASEAVDQLKKAISSFARINESGAYFLEIRQLQSGVQAIITREKLIRQYNEEQLEVRVRSAARKIRSCAMFSESDISRKRIDKIDGFSSDVAYQQLYMNLLTITDYLEAINLLAVCRKIHVLDSCVFSAFYTAISTDLLLRDSALITLLARDYRTCIRILYYHSLFEEAGTTLNFEVLGATLRECIKKLCLATPQLLAKLKEVTADSIAQALNLQTFSTAYSSILTENSSDALYDIIYMLEGAIKRITTDSVNIQGHSQTQHIIEQLTTQDKTICIDTHPSYISHNQDRLLVAQSIVNRLAFSPSYLSMNHSINSSTSSITPTSLAAELTAAKLETIQNCIFTLLGSSGTVELLLQYDSTLAYGTHSFYAPALIKLYSVILEYSVALARLEDIYKHHDVSWKPELTKASFIDGISRILFSFGYIDCSFVVRIDEDLCNRGENSDALKALHAFNTDLNPEIKKLLAAACLQASRYGLLTYASLLLGCPLPLDHAISLETAVLCAYKNATEKLCRHCLSSIIGGTARPSESVINKSAYLLSFTAELLITIFVGCPLLEQYLKTPHGLCSSIIALTSQAVVAALVATKNITYTQRPTVSSFLSSLSKNMLHFGSTSYKSLAYSCLGDRRYDASAYVSATTSSSEYEEMCVVYETYGDTYCFRTSMPLIVLGITVRRHKVLTTFYQAKGIDSLIELIKVDQQGVDAHRLFMPGDMSAIIKTFLEDGSSTSETVARELISFIKSGTFIWNLQN